MEAREAREEERGAHVADSGDGERARRRTARESSLGLTRPEARRPPPSADATRAAAPSPSPSPATHTTTSRTSTRAAPRPRLNVTSGLLGGNDHVCLNLGIQILYYFAIVLATDLSSSHYKPFYCNFSL
ncbi:unnamed protein product [Danaus chrysippus]|uniref:(African queen) hypothetical protein n=1 Tax=Danaus chrysippus TaxID=151541 RepID=A0A8J2R1D6_9NEOP|nr:unnamed protein product [Danaus chrysippus]